MVIWYKNGMPFLDKNKNPLLRKDKRQLTYFLVANWDISEAIQKYGQDNTDTLGRHMMHMYIHDTLIPNILEGMYNVTTKVNLLENYGLPTLWQEKK